MKTKILIFLLLLSMAGYGQVYRLTHHLIKHQCYICGIDIWNCEKISESNYFDDDGIYLGSMPDCFGYSEHEQTAVNSEWNMGVNMLVCKACYDKYIKPITDKINNEFADYLEWAIKENKNKRTEYDKQRKREEIDLLEKQIQELRDQINIKEGGKKPSPGIIYKQSRIQCDTTIPHEYKTK